MEQDLIDQLFKCPYFGHYYKPSELLQEVDPEKAIGECRKGKIAETIGFEDCKQCLTKPREKKIVQKTLF